MSKDQPPVLVLGLGNVLMRDEGVGVRIAETLTGRYALPPGVEVIDGGTSGMELMEAVAGRRRLVVADAITAGAAPGTILRLEGEALRAWFRSRISPHQLGLADLLAALALSGQAPEGVVVFGIVPEDISLGIELSTKVASAADRVAALIAEEVGAGVSGPDLAAVTQPWWTQGTVTASG